MKPGALALWWIDWLRGRTMASRRQAAREQSKPSDRMPKRADFPALGQVLESYFHQDWLCEHDTEAEVVQAIIAHEPLDSVHAAAEELTALLARGLTEGELQLFLYGVLYVDYLPPADGMSYTQWLDTLRRTFANAGHT
jgi:hypothetical protein